MILYGKVVSEKIYEEIKEESEKRDKKPKLAVVLVGNNSSSLRYIKQKEKYATYLGFGFELFSLDENIKEDELLKVIKKLNEDDSIDGYIVQLPLPKSINEKNIISAISPKKDIDGFHIENQGKIVVGDNEGLIACTPYGILEILNYYNIDVVGKNIVVIGRSNIVGKPIANLLINKQATVIVCNSKTKDIKYYTKNADIVILAMGKPRFLKSEMINKNTIIIDVGFSIVDGKIYGDADFEDIRNNGNSITPVPGGVGVLTVASLMKNTLKAFKNKNKY